MASSITKPIAAAAAADAAAPPPIPAAASIPAPVAAPKPKSKDLGCTLATALEYKLANIKNPLAGMKDLWVAITKKPIITIADEEVELDLSGGEGFNRISLKKHYLPNETLSEDMISYYNDFPSILENATHDRKEFLKTFLKGLKYRYNTIRVELNKNVKEQGDTRNVRRKTDQEQKLGDLIKRVHAIIKDLDSPQKKTVEAMEKVKENELQSLIRKFAMLVLRTNPSTDQQKFITTLREMEEVPEDKIDPKSPLETQVAALASGDIYRDLVSDLDPQLFEGLTADTTKGKILEIIKKKSDLEGELRKQNQASAALQKKVEDAEEAKRIAEEAKQTSETNLLEAQSRLTDSVGTSTVETAVQAVQTALGIRDQSVEDHLVKDIALRRAKEEALAAEELAARTQAKLNQVRAELSSVEDDAERKTRELGGARSEIAMLKAAIAEKEAAALQAITVAKNNLDASEAKLKEAEAKLKEAEANLEEAKAKRVGSNTATQTLEVIRANASVTAAANEVADAEAQTEALREETVKAAAVAAAEISELKLRYATSERALRNEKAEAAAKELIIQRLNVELANAKAELDALQRAQPVNNQDEITRLSSELAEKEKEITATREELARIQSELDALKESKSRNNQDKIANLTAKVAEKEELIANNNTELLALREQVAAVRENEEKIKALTAQVDTLNYQLNNLREVSQNQLAEVRQKSEKTIEAAQSNAAAKIAAATAAATALQRKSVEYQEKLDTLTAAKAEIETTSKNNKQKLNAITDYATKILRGEQVDIQTSMNAPVKEMLEKFGSKSGDVCVLAYFVNYFYSALRPSKEFMKKIDDITTNTTDLYKVLIEIEPALLLANKVQYSYAGIYEIQQNTDEFTTIFSRALSIDPKQAKAIVRTRIDSYDNIIEIISDNGRVLLFNKLLDNKMPTKFFTYSNGILQNTTPIEIPKSGTISYDVLFLIFLSVSKKYVNKILTEDPLKCMTVRSEIIENKCIPIFIKENSNGIRLSAHTIETLSKPPFCFKTSGFQEMKSDKEYNIAEILSEMNILLKKFSSNCKLNEKFPIPPGFAINYSMPPVFKTLPQYNNGEKIGAKLSTVGDLIEVSYYTCPSKRGGGTKKRTKHAKNFTQKKR